MMMSKEILDINELSYLLNTTHNEKIRLENENIEIDSLLQIEINRFMNEKDSYENMIQKKYLLKEFGNKISNSIEITLAKLEQIFLSLNRNDQILVYIECIDSYLKQKSYLILRVSELRQSIDQLTESIDELEMKYSSEFLDEVAQSSEIVEEKKKELESIRGKISLLLPKLEQLSNQSTRCKLTLEDLESNIRNVERSIEEKKIQILSLTREIETMRDRHEHDSKELSDTENALILELNGKQEELEVLMSEMNSDLSKLANSNELLNLVTQNRADNMEIMRQLQLDIENVKTKQLKLDDDIRKIEGDIRSAEAMSAVTESAIAAQQRITESYEEQSKFILDSRRPLEDEILQMTESIEETKRLIHVLEKQHQELTFPALLPVLSRIKETVNKKENILTSISNVQVRIAELQQTLERISGEEKTVSSSLYRLQAENCDLTDANTQLAAQIDQIQTSSTDLHKKLEDARALVLEKQRELPEIEAENETMQKELNDLEMELESTKSKNEERMQSLISSHIESEVEKRLEKRKGVLRSKNSREIMQMQNKIKEADEVFRMEVKKSNEEFQNEKSALESEIEKYNLDRGL